MCNALTHQSGLIFRNAASQLGFSVFSFISQPVGLLLRPLCPLHVPLLIS